MRKFSNLENRKRLNESMNTDNMIHNRGKEKSIKDYLPNFYEDNKERIDNGKIKFFYDPYATETGCVIDLETLECFIVDTRA